MKDNTNVVLWYSIVLLLFLNGCKPMQWFEEAIPQVADGEQTQHIVDTYVRCKKIYRQASTVASMAALFLADEVRKAYVESYSYRHFLSDREKLALLKRLQHEDEEAIAFYVAGSQRSVEYENGYQLFTGTYHKPEYLLGGENPAWTPTLRVAGKEYAPVKIKSIEIPLEYKEFFGNNINQFKTTYAVYFDAKDSQTGKQILEKEPQKVELIFRGIYKEIVLTWESLAYHMTV